MLFFFSTFMYYFLFLNFISLAGKSSITDYGTIEKIGEKLAAKR